MSSDKQRKRKRTADETTTTTTAAAAAAPSTSPSDEAAQREQAIGLAKAPEDAGDDHERRRAAKRARKEAKKLSKAEKKALKKQKKKEAKRQEKKRAKAKSTAQVDVAAGSPSGPSPQVPLVIPSGTSASFNPFASHASQATENPFAVAATSTFDSAESDAKGNVASNFPPGFDFEATKRHLVRKQASGPLTAEDKSLLQSIEKHISRPDYVAPVRRALTPVQPPKGFKASSSKAKAQLASSTGGHGGPVRIAAKRSATRISASKDLTTIDASGLTNAECLAEKQYTGKQLKWLQEDRPDFTIRWGRFGAAEAEAVEKRLKEWEQENDTDRDTVISMIFDRTKRDAEAYVNLIKALTYAVPYRSFDTVRRFVREHYNPLSGQGAWTEEEISKLRQAVAQYGKDWEKASAIVGRSRSDCRLFVRDSKEKLEVGGPSTKDVGNTAPTGGSDCDDEEQAESSLEDSQSQGQGQTPNQVLLRAWTEEETQKLKDAISSLSGTPEAKGRQPSEALFPWKLVAERMSTSRGPGRLRAKWQKLSSREARSGSAAVVQQKPEEEGEVHDVVLPKGRYRSQRDDYLLVKSLEKAEEAMEFDDVAAVNWGRVGQELKLPNAGARQNYTRMVKQYLGEERIDSSFKAVLADLEAPTKAAREAFLAYEEQKAEIKAERKRRKTRAWRERERIKKLEKEQANQNRDPSQGKREGVSEGGRKRGKKGRRETQMKEDLIDSEEER